MNAKKIVPLTMCFILALMPIVMVNAMQKSCENGSVVTEGFTSTDKRGKDDILLVNYQYPLPSTYKPNLIELANKEKVDKSIYPSLQAMFDDARPYGLNLKVNSGYRSYEEQIAIMDIYIQDYINQGMSEDVARAEAAKWVAQPGYSEHETGLAVDIGPGDGCISSRMLYTWLARNAHNYGFILRYPQSKKSITHVEGEQWHFRYVGQKAATQIYEEGICLEIGRAHV